MFTCQPNKHWTVPSQQHKHFKKVWNMLKVNNKISKNMSTDTVLVSSFLPLSIIHTFFHCLYYYLWACLYYYFEHFAFCLLVSYSTTKYEFYKDSFWGETESIDVYTKITSFKGTIMQIWKPVHVFVFIRK